MILLNERKKTPGKMSRLMDIFDFVLDRSTRCRFLTRRRYHCTTGSKSTLFNGGLRVEIYVGEDSRYSYQATLIYFDLFSVLDVIILAFANIVLPFRMSSKK